jgi:ribonuclease HIII
MNDEARDLDRLVRDWWISESRDDLFRLILECAITAQPTSLLPFARALQILETQQLRPTVKARVDELRCALDKLRQRELQVDELGDLNNEPQTLFAILDKDVAALQGFNLDLLRQARLSHQESRGRAAKAFLEALGPDRLSREIADALRQAADDLIDREQYQAWGLFVAHDISQGIALGLKIVLNDSSTELFNDAEPDMWQQARIAARLGMEGQGWDAKIEWPARFAGESIGLPIFIAALVARRILPCQALTASTGRLDIDGRVTGVSGIEAKIDAARRIGIRRVLVPRDNFNRAKDAAGQDIVVLPIEHVRDVLSALRQPLSPIELGYSGLVLLIRASIGDYHLVLKDELDSDQGHRFVVANASGDAQIWVYRNCNVRAEGRSGPALDDANRLVKERIPSNPEQRDVLTFQLPTGQLQDAYRAVLQDAGAVDDTPRQYEAWRMQLVRGRSRATVVLYSSKKCVVQGTAPACDMARTAAESITKDIGGLPTRNAAMPSAKQDSTDNDSEPHIGNDEAGKGDYFGPLVSAAVFVDRESAARLRQLGVRDSKLISDSRIRELADKVRQMPEVRHAVTAIYPRKYNDLYERFRKEGKNLNSLLAWGHARSIENLLSAPANKRTSAKYVVVDQFADKSYVEQRTRKAGIPVHQRHKAEEDIAVAAASVLARDGFLQWLDKWSTRTQITLPKGASPQVVEAAKQFVRRWGAKWLGEVAKLHFRTTADVLKGEDTNADKHPPHWISDAPENARES